MTGLPDLLTVEEAARILRIGRTKAYAMAREWRRTGGSPVCPCRHRRPASPNLPARGHDRRTDHLPRTSPDHDSRPSTDRRSASSERKPGNGGDGNRASARQAVSTDPAPQPSISAARSARLPSRRRTRMANQPTLPFPG